MHGVGSNSRERTRGLEGYHVAKTCDMEELWNHVGPKWPKVLPSAPNKVRLRDDLQGRESWGPFIALQNGPHEVAHHPGWDPLPTLGQAHLKLASRSSSLHGGCWSLVLLQVWVCLSHELDNEDHPSGYICSSPRLEKIEAAPLTDHHLW